MDFLLFLLEYDKINIWNHIIEFLFIYLKLFICLLYCSPIKFMGSQFIKYYYKSCIMKVDYEFLFIFKKWNIFYGINIVFTSLYYLRFPIMFCIIVNLNNWIINYHQVYLLNTNDFNIFWKYFLYRTNNYYSFNKHKFLNCFMKTK